MADALVSAVVTPILDNLTSLLLEEMGLVSGLRTEFEKLQSTLSTIQAVLHDAEKKQWKSDAVKNWLRKLKDAAYDAEDVVDEIAIEARRRGQPRGFKNPVRGFFSLDQNPLIFRVKMAHKLKNVRDKLDDIAKERQFHLTVGGGDVEADSSDWRQTWSLVNESEIYGRDEEKEELIESLVNNSDDLSVYAICGMGGLGKTTLAQLVYTDGRVRRHFDQTIWVCVSDDSTAEGLTRAMIEFIENSPCDITGLENLQRRLQEKLSGKKFLLVLDDVWDDFNDKWSSLKVLLRCGAKGCAVLVTTRIERVALKMEPVLSQHLDRLSDDDSWLLFEQFAFRTRSREEYVNLEIIGRAIVNKCGGVPLAIKALGSLMRLKKNESQWLSVERSELWDLPEEGSMILPALRLSYTNLPSHLKQCFAFCCIFPKDHVMEKGRLIAMWMANGFIPCKGHMDLHDMGHEIFDQLVGRSFFQEVKEYENGYTTCKMHDLMHDLAQSIMLHECCSVESNQKLEISKPFRHVALWRTYGAPDDGDKCLKFESLRSLFLHGGYEENWSEVLHLCFSRQKHLRALDVATSSIERLPESIGNLKHLRYLDVSGSPIKTLPESTSSLQNLETLNLCFCASLLRLPKEMKHLKNLVYLDITGCESLRFMPSGMGRLICLRKLDLFIVGKDDGQHIGELERLNNLGGELSIRGLGNVKDLRDAKSANLMAKTALQSLSLSWYGNGSEIGRGVIRENIEEVIDGLQPHTNMKKLRMDGYGGSKYPNWMMNLMLPNLVEMRLMGCPNCEQLPPLGKLQFLKRLYLEGMDGVKCIGSDVYGDGENPFPSLEELRLQSMRNFEKWENVAGTQSFPRLRVLTLHGCPELIEIPILPSIQTLDIWNSSVTVSRSVRNLTSLTSLKINYSYKTIIPHLKLLPDGFLQNHTLLEHLGIWNLENLESLSNQILDNLSSLKSLTIVWCPELESLPEEGLRNLNSLETLSIRDCNRLKSLPTNGLCGLSSLRKLSVEHCAKFASLSEGVRYLTALEDLRLYHCPLLNSLPESIQHLTSLLSLCIIGCEGLSSLPDQIGYLTSLSRLTIRNCPNLMCLPHGVQSLNMLRELKIARCQNLERRCEKERGEDWPKIAHIPYIEINHIAIQRLN